MAVYTCRGRPADRPMVERRQAQASFRWTGMHERGGAQWRLEWNSGSWEHMSWSAREGGAGRPRGRTEAAGSGRECPACVPEAKEEKAGDVEEGGWEPNTDPTVLGKE